MALSKIADVVIRRTASGDQKPDLVKVNCSTRQQRDLVLTVLNIYGISSRIYSSFFVVSAEINPQYATSDVVNEIESVLLASYPSLVISKPT